MLSYLTIHNFGLIDELSVDFCSKLNILTGETGAGKSIIIDALRCALGERLNSSNIRDNTQPCMVEAVFDCSPKLIDSYSFLAEFFDGRDRTLIINRTIQPDGRNKIKVNNQSVTVSILKEIGAVLIDFHGPHDHQMLLNPESHIQILDRLCSFDTTHQEYIETYNEYQSIQKQIKEIDDSRASRERDLDLLSHQIEELEQVPLDEAKYEESQQEFARLSNTEKLFEHAKTLLRIFEQDDLGITDMVSQSFSHIRHLSTTDDSTHNLEDQLTTIQETTDTFIAELNAYHDSLSFSPDKAEEITRICDSYTDIFHKYGTSIAEVKLFYEESKKKYDLLVNLEHNDNELKTQLVKTQKTLSNLAEKLSTERKRVAQGLKKTIEKELKELGIKHVLFECRITQTDFSINGYDSLLFYISPNAGESIKPLAEIVSSGEAARVMLALKKALMKVDPISVLIFDEIDAQIGGRLGSITGKKLKELSSDRQVILITHLPQIASFADIHFKVEKAVHNNHTEVTVQQLSGHAIIEELAHMMSGSVKNDISLEHAKEMLLQAKNECLASRIN